MKKRRRKYRGPTQLALRRNDLAHFDLLPAELRRKLNESNVKFSSEAIYRWWCAGMSPAMIIRQLRANEDEFAQTWQRR